MLGPGSSFAGHVVWAVGWQSTGISIAGVKNRIDIKPDGRCKTASAQEASIHQKTSAYMNEIAAGKIPYLARLEKVAIVNFGWEDGASLEFNPGDFAPGTEEYRKELARLYEQLNFNLDAFPAFRSAEWPQDKIFDIFAFDVRTFLKILGAELINAGFSLPAALWRDNRRAYDPFDECASHDIRNSKVSYHRVLQVGQIEVDEEFAPGQDALTDAWVVEKMVRRYRLA